MKEGYQNRVARWMLQCFGLEIAEDKTERNHRFIEEALELVQACGCSKEDVLMLVDYTFDQPIGEKGQEVGGVMVTLAALCEAQGLRMGREGLTELHRIWKCIDQIRQKQKTKPRNSALPADVPRETLKDVSQ